MKDFFKLIAIPVFFVAGIILIGSENSYDNYILVQIVKAFVGFALIGVAVFFYKNFEKELNDKK